LDPRTKLVLTALFTVLVFIIDVLSIAALQMVMFTGLCLAAKIPLKKIFPHARLLGGVIALVIVLQALFGEGLYTGLMISCRVIALTALMPALTMTTDPQILALGITRLGLNYRAAYIFTSTLNLIPSFEEEARQIIDARRLRGMQSVRGAGAALREYPAIVLPLMVKAMRQAQLMSLAMDARAFGAYRTRTWLHEIKLSAVDYGAFAAGIAWFAIAVTANTLLAG
jgi:energy-coupling factor transporter transmembrane protein EcfT